MQKNLMCARVKGFCLPILLCAANYFTAIETTNLNNLFGKGFSRFRLKADFLVKKKREMGYSHIATMWIAHMKRFKLISNYKIKKKLIQYEEFIKSRIQIK